MADIVDRATRSRMMSGIRGKNTKPELLVRRFLHRAGLRFRLHSRGLPGRPDIVLPRFRTVVFVHGCFWHRHRGCRYCYTPTSNRQFWLEKFERNVARDRANHAALTRLGWRVILVWECETANEKRLARVVSRIRGKAIRDGGSTPPSREDVRNGI